MNAAASSPSERRAPGARRSWLFVEGANEEALVKAPESGADVLIQELEDFTAPKLRPHARAISPDVIARWRESGVITAVRINPFETVGLEDLEAVMRGAPDIVLLPKASSPDQIRRLDSEIGRLEADYGLSAGTTEIVPNVELACGLIRTYDICRASRRTTGCLVASEDMAADLGAERSREALELDYVRSRFHVECVAAGVPSIDCPYTWTDLDGLELDARKARRLGYRAKSAVHAAHAEVINRVFTPSPDEVAHARRIVETFEQAQARGDARVELDGSLLEVPIYLNAKRLLDRARELEN